MWGNTGGGGGSGAAGKSAYQIWLDNGNTGTEQDFLDSLVGPQGPPGSGSGGSSKLVIGGNVRFAVDFIAKTITWTTWNLWTSYAQLTLSAGTKSFANMGNSTFYYVVLNSNTIELVTTAAIASHAGYPIFGLVNTTIFPFSYPLNQIGVRGGTIFNRPDLSIGEWTIIGDSNSQGQSWWLNVREQFYIPIVDNLAVAGMSVSGVNGMWTKAADVSPTTRLVTIMGGGNDADNVYPNSKVGQLLPIGSTFDTNTFYGAYQQLIEDLLTANPSLKIILITPTRAWDSNGNLRTNRGLIAEDVKKIGAFYGLPVIDLYNNMGLNELNKSSYLNADNLHLNGGGYAKVGAMVCGALKQY